LNQADFCISYALQLGKAACDKVQKLFLRANDDDETLGMELLKFMQPFNIIQPFLTISVQLYTCFNLQRGVEHVTMNIGNASRS
jgi:hypothetical protein